MDHLNRFRWWLVSLLSGIPQQDLRFARTLYDYDAASRAMQRAVSRARRQATEGRPQPASSGAVADSVGSGGQPVAGTGCPSCGVPPFHLHLDGCVLMPGQAMKRPGQDYFCSKCAGNDVPCHHILCPMGTGSKMWRKT